MNICLSGVLCFSICSLTADFKDLSGRFPVILVKFFMVTFIPGEELGERFSLLCQLPGSQETAEWDALL